MKKGKVGLFIAAMSAAYSAYKLYKKTREERMRLKTQASDFLKRNLGVFKNPAKKKNNVAMGNYYY